jgi:hypothetical protein
MDIPEEPGAVFALLAVFVVVGFLFLLGLGRGRSWGRRQAGLWVLLTVLFFLVCGGLVRSNVARRAAQRLRLAPSLVFPERAATHK